MNVSHEKICDSHSHCEFMQVGRGNEITANSGSLNSSLVRLGPSHFDSVGYIIAVSYQCGVRMDRFFFFLTQQTPWRRDASCKQEISMTVLLREFKKQIPITRLRIPL